MHLFIYKYYINFSNSCIDFLLYYTCLNENFINILILILGVQRTPEEEVNLAKQRQEIKHSNTRFIKSPFDERENQEQIKQIAQSQVSLFIYFL